MFKKNYKLLNYCLNYLANFSIYLLILENLELIHNFSKNKELNFYFFLWYFSSFFYKYQKKTIILSYFFKNVQFISIEVYLSKNKISNYREVSENRKHRKNIENKNNRIFFRLLIHWFFFWFILKRWRFNNRSMIQQLF